MPRPKATSPRSSRTSCRSSASTSPISIAGCLPSRRRCARRSGAADGGTNATRPGRRHHQGGPVAMRIGFVGLGRMGANMVRRLLKDGHEVVAYNRTAEKTKEIEGEGAIGSYSIEELVGKLEKPRAVWIMVPAGDATEAQIAGADGAPRAGRHDHRRRQHELPRRPAPTRSARGAGRPVRRRGHVRRDLGPPGRLLPDGRRRRGRGEAARADLPSRSHRRAATSTSAERAPGTT